MSHEILNFESESNVHKIIVECDYYEKNALINTMVIADESPVELVLLLKSMCKKLKEIGIENIIQHLTAEDWDLLENMNVFEFVTKSKYDKIIVKCNVDIFPESVMKALGLA